MNFLHKFYINLLDNLQLIPEINTSFTKGSDFNSTLALRYHYSSEASVDFYYSNVIARSSKTMAKCRNEKIKLKDTGTHG